MVFRCLGKIALPVLAFIVAVNFIVAGIGKGQAVAGDTGVNPLLGKQKSKVQVVVVTDWFCPACRTVEPTIEQIYQDVADKATVAFIDYAIHPESLNYSPYNLSFQIYEKGKYLQARRALAGLANKTRNPSVTQIEEAVKPLGINYKGLSFAEATAGVQFYQAVVQRLQVHSTPTVIVRNNNTGKVVRMDDARQITVQNVRNAIRMIN